MTINFTKISLKFCSLHHPAIINLSRKCPNLTTFEFDLSTMKLDYDDEEVTSSTFDACARAVAKYCTNLEVLSLSGWDITDACMPALSTLTSLKELDLTKCSDLSSEPIQAMLRALPGLAKLSLDEIPADEALLRCVGESCHNLTYLRLTVEDCGQVALETMIRACPLLEDVNLGPDVDHADAVLVALSTYCRGLKVLDIVGATDVGMRALLRHCTQLTDLILWAMAPFVHPELTVSELPCPSLTKLTINNRDMTDIQFSTLFSHCPNLAKLYLNSCHLMSNMTLAIIAQYCTQITSLELEDSDECRLTIPGIATLLTLRCLTISDMSVDSATLKALATGRCAHTLTEITLGNCTDVAIDDMLAFVSSCTCLSSFNIYGYHKCKADKRTLKMHLTAAYPQLHVWINGYSDY